MSGMSDLSLNSGGLLGLQSSLVGGLLLMSDDSADQKSASERNVLPHLYINLCLENFKYYNLQLNPTIYIN